MKLKLLKLDGTEAGEHELSNFPQLEDGKGLDALRQVILAVRANKRQKCIYKTSIRSFWIW